MALPNITLLIRVAQAFLALIVLGLSAYVAQQFNEAEFSVHQVNFMIFAAVWTLLVTAFLTIATFRFPSAANKFVVVAIEAVTMIFWFAGFIALAVLFGDLRCGNNPVCGSARGAAALGAFEWLLFSGSLVLAILHIFRSRGTGDNSAAPKVHGQGVHGTV